MNKATIDSIEWHKTQIFKLLESNDLYKEEDAINSIKVDLDGIIEKAKKKVWVKATSKRKGHYREQEVGRKEPIADSEDAGDEGVRESVTGGDQVDFGIYGKLYVLNTYNDEKWRVTDLEADRYSPDASGWFIRSSYAKKIVDAGTDSFDERDLEDVDPFANY